MPQSYSGSFAKSAAASCDRPHHGQAEVCIDRLSGQKRRHCERRMRQVYARENEIPAAAADAGRVTFGLTSSWRSASMVIKDIATRQARSVIARCLGFVRRQWPGFCGPSGDGDKRKGKRLGKIVCSITVVRSAIARRSLSIDRFLGTNRQPTQQNIAACSAKCLGKRNHKQCNQPAITIFPTSKTAMKPRIQPGKMRRSAKVQCTVRQTDTAQMTSRFGSVGHQVCAPGAAGNKKQENQTQVQISPSTRVDERESSASFRPEKAKTKSRRKGMNRVRPTEVRTTFVCPGIQPKRQPRQPSRATMPSGRNKSKVSATTCPKKPN